MACLKKNMGIELLRFVFSIIIVLGHSASSFFRGGEQTFAIARQGAIGVEFFFILSGVLMAKTCNRDLRMAGQEIAFHDLGNATISFLKKKYFSVYPTHIFAFTVLFIEYVCFSNIGVISASKILICALPEILLFHMNGIRMENINPNDWYISAMLLAMLFLYPLHRKYGSYFSKVVAPVITLIILGYCYMSTGTMTPSDTPLLGGMVMKGTLRAVAEVSLGTTVYEAITWLNTIALRKRGIWLLQAIEVSCYTLTIMVSCTDSDGRWYFPFIFILATGILITFSKYSVFAKIKQSKTILYLGNLSMTIFLCQRIVLYPLQRLNCFEGYWINTGIFLAGTIVLSIIAKTVIDKLTRNKDLVKRLVIE